MVSDMQQSTSDVITYVIPTHNRPAFLRRLLHFFAMRHLKSRLIVADSSEPDEHRQNVATLAEYARQLNATIQHIGAGFISKCRQSVESVTTPYVVFCADDDFLMPDVVEACVRLLQDEPDCAAAKGRVISMHQNRNNRCYELPVHDVLDADPIRRFREFGDAWFCTFYSVCRTTNVVHAFQSVDAATDYSQARIFPEIMLSQMHMLAGKYRYVPQLYHLREEHDINESHVVPNIVARERQREYFTRFHAGLACEFESLCDATTATAGSLIDRQYGYLTSPDHERRQRRFSMKWRRRIRRRVHRILDFFLTDAVRVRRRSRDAARLSDEDAWQLACRLMVEYPDGMSPTSISTRAA